MFCFSCSEKRFGLECSDHEGAVLARLFNLGPTVAAVAKHPVGACALRRASPESPAGSCASVGREPSALSWLAALLPGPKSSAPSAFLQKLQSFWIRPADLRQP